MKNLLIFCLLLVLSVIKAQSQELKLWYKQPADEWMKATPVGNGRLGAMIYGGVETETIALNEISLWSGQFDENQEPLCGKEKLAEIRQLFFEGKIAEGNTMAGEFMSGKPHSFGTHLPMGNLKIDFPGQDMSVVSGYKRELNLRNAITSVSYKIGKVQYKREYICSNPDDVLLIKLSANKKAALNLNLYLDLLRKSDISVSDQGISFSGQALFPKLGHGGVFYQGKIKISTKGGWVETTEDKFSVRDANEVIIAIDVRTDYKNPNYRKICFQTVSKALSKKYDFLKQSHINDYKKLFDRVELFLGETITEQLPTDIRWQQLKNGNPDSGLEALFFQYGRYLLIASSRENSPLPANLQGVWNDNLACNMPWTCDYHLDVNTQQNYWAANIANLSECNQPLFRYIEDLAVYGRNTARKVYGSPGWVAHTVANVWGYTAPGASVSWGAFPCAGVWLSSHLWEHYLFTKDVEFLRTQAYPLLREAAIFFQDYLVENPNNGYLMTGPCNSPENAFYFNGGEYALSMMPTSDRILLYELYTACIESSKILNLDTEFCHSLEQARQKFPPFKIGKNGELQEWFEDYQTAHPNHRHAMHTLSIYPYNQLTLAKNPELVRSAQLAMENKLRSENWEDVEFCRAMMVSFFARVKEAEKAHSSLSVLMTKLLRENLFTVSLSGVALAEEDIFIFDGNEAGVAAMAEMLIQAHEGYIEFLPALPKAWPSGHFKGLCVKGGAEADVSWENGVVKKAMLKATVDNIFQIKVPGKNSFETRKMKKGEIWKIL